ncbi:MAG: hemerythrin domain-containing protein [Bauldia sp.]
MTIDLDTRAGLPEELRLLLERFPRDIWPAHANLGPLAQFWLQIHEGFRDTSSKLQARAVDFREGRMTATEYKDWFAPRLNVLLGHLHGHHQIEDFQFFPLFAAAEPRLVRGFEILEQDHEAIHETLGALVDSANALLKADDANADQLRFAADRYAGINEHLLRQLHRHLEDEEDLIIPLILDRGEGPLGIG